MHFDMLEDIVLIVQEKPNVWARKVICPSLWKIAQTYRPPSVEDYPASEILGGLVSVPEGSPEYEALNSALLENLGDIRDQLIEFTNALKGMNKSIESIGDYRYVQFIVDEDDPDYDPEKMSPESVVEYEQWMNPEVLWDLIVRLSEINRALQSVDNIGKDIYQTYSENLGKTAAEELSDIDTRQFFLHHQKLTDAQKAERQVAIVKLVSLAEEVELQLKNLLYKFDGKWISKDAIGCLKVLKSIADVQQNFEDQFRSIFDNYLSEPRPSAEMPGGEISEEDVPTEIHVHVSEDFPEEEEIEEAPVSMRRPPQTLRSEFSELPSEDVPLSSLEEPSTMPKPNWWEEEEESQSGDIETMSWIKDFEGTDKMRDTLIKLQHVKFVDELKKASSHNDPLLLAAMICRYSGQIEEIDPEASLKLIAIAEGVLGD